MKTFVVRAGLAAGGTALTAVAMVIAAWGLPAVASAGPRAGARVALLVPQIEVTMLLLIAAPLGAAAFRATRFEAFRRALAVTPRGARVAVARAVVTRLASFAIVIAGGLLAWLGAMLLPAGPAFGQLGATRLLLLVMAAFAIALGTWLCTAWRGSRAAPALAAGVVVAMAALPLAIAPLVAVAGARAWLLGAAMLLCPWIVVAGASGLDLVRMEWMYAFSPLGSLEAPYPGVLAAATSYAAAALALLLLAVRSLGRRGGFAS